MKIKEWKEYEKKAKKTVRDIEKSLVGIARKKELSGKEIFALKLIDDLVFSRKWRKDALVHDFAQIFYTRDVDIVRSAETAKVSK